MISFQTERLKLEFFCEEDIDRYYDILKQENVNKWLGSGSPITKDKIEKIIENDLKHWDKYSIGTWAVKLKENNIIIGHCGFNYIEKLDSFELLYAFDQAYWRKGYASEAASASMEWAKEHSDLKKVIALAYPNNHGSIKVIDKLGFTYVGQKKLFGVELNLYEKII
jgi:ribosomal-protein-alanine N-acetyltransferase